MDTNTPPHTLSNARVPGSELAKRVFYTSVTGLTAEDVARCPYGCTLAATQQGIYMLDHVQRVAYPLPTAHRNAAEDNAVAAGPAVGSENANTGRGDLVEVGQRQHSGLTDDEVERMVAEAVARRVAELEQQHAAEIQAKNKVIHRTETTIRERKEQVQALKLKLEQMRAEQHKDPETTPSLGTEKAPQGPSPLPGGPRGLAPSTSAAPVSPPASPPITAPIAAAGVVAGTAAVAALAPDVGGTTVAPPAGGRGEGRERERKRGRERRERSPGDRNKRTIRYGDTRIGVADDDDSSLSTSSSSWSTSSSGTTSSRSSSRSGSLASSGGTPPHDSSHQRSDGKSREDEEALDRARRESYRSAATRRGGNTATQNSQSTNPAPITIGAAAVTARTAVPSSQREERISNPKAAATSPAHSSDDVALGAASPPAVGLQHDQVPNSPSSVAIPVAKSQATLPTHLIRNKRAVTLYCHLCRTFFAPHPVNLRQHLLTPCHRKICAQVDDYILKAGAVPFLPRVAAGEGGGEVTGQRALTPDDALWHRLTAVTRMRGDGKGRHPASRSEFGKVTLNLPEYVVATSVSEEEDRLAERAAGNSLFDEGIDLVLPTCSVCGDVVSVQSYKRHEATPKHQQQLTSHQRGQEREQEKD